MEGYNDISNRMFIVPSESLVFISILDVNNLTTLQHASVSGRSFASSLQDLERLEYFSPLIRHDENHSSTLTFGVFFPQTVDGLCLLETRDFFKILFLPDIGIFCLCLKHEHCTVLSFI